MKKAKHTKGPWEHNDSGLIYGQVSGDHDEAPFVAEVIDDEAHRVLGICSPMETANARLIAAAPELAESLKDVLTAFEGYDADWEPDSSGVAIIKAARAALKKAGVL